MQRVTVAFAVDTQQLNLLAVFPIAMIEDETGLYEYSVKRFGEVLFLKTVAKFRLDLENLALLYRQHRSNQSILEYWKMLKLNLDDQVNVWIKKHGGLQALADGKKGTIDGVVKDFTEYFAKNAKAWADQEKKAAEAAKNRRKYIYDAFTELGLHISESTLIKGVLQLSGVGIKQLAAEEEAIRGEIDAMAKEQKVGWVKKGQGLPGIVLMEDDNGEATDAAATWTKKLQYERPLRGRAAAK